MFTCRRSGGVGAHDGPDGFGTPVAIRPHQPIFAGHEPIPP